MHNFLRCIILIIFIVKLFDCVEHRNARKRVSIISQFARDKIEKKFGQLHHAGSADEYGKKENELDYIRRRLTAFHAMMKKKLMINDKDETINKTLHRQIFDKRIVGDEYLITEINRHLNEYLYQGDIMLTREQLDDIISTNSDKKRRNAMNLQTYTTALWPLPIPYTFESTLSAASRSAATRAIHFWQENTCVTFAENGAGANKLEFIDGGGCWSHIGRVVQWPVQQVSIGVGCEHLGIACHEIQHALGFFHEQARFDRDAYIALNTSNIMSGTEGNFAKESPHTMNTYGVQYEYGSVMHYSSRGFANDYSMPTLTARDANYQNTMGNRVQPSFYDVLLVNTHYGCLKTCANAVTKCENGGYPDPKFNCAICKCPSGFAGSLCDQLPTSTPIACGGLIAASMQWQMLAGNVGLFDDDSITMQDYAFCHWRITSPAGSHIEIKQLNISSVCTYGCFYASLELKMKKDFRPTGYRYCCPSDVVSQTIQSETNLVPIIAQSRRGKTKFVLQYRYVFGVITGANPPASNTVVGAVIDEEDGSGEGITEEASGTDDDNVKGKTQLLQQNRWKQRPLQRIWD